MPCSVHPGRRHSLTSSLASRGSHWVVTYDFEMAQAVVAIFAASYAIDDELLASLHVDYLVAAVDPSLLLQTCFL